MGAIAGKGKGDGKHGDDCGEREICVGNERDG